jgi:hypothetical protein
MIARLADIERRMPDLGLLQLAAPLHDPAVPRVDVLVSRNMQWAENLDSRQDDYADCWSGLEKRFDLKRREPK